MNQVSGQWWLYHDYFYHTILIRFLDNVQLHVTQLSFPHFPIQVQEADQVGKGHLE